MSDGNSGPTYPDAIGYLDDLVGDVDAPWFRMLRDLAVDRGISALSPNELEAVCAVFAACASYTSASGTVAATPAPAASAANSDFLERVFDFSDFKYLCDTLDLVFTKPITIIFGANGSGKSSLCESLKLLAEANKPVRPLRNQKSAGSAGTPSFKYKFASDSQAQQWDLSSGYGLRTDAIDYFDSDVAAQNIRMAVEPGRVILLTPFKLQVFETVKSLVNELRAELRLRQQRDSEALGRILSELRLTFVDFPSRPMGTVDEHTTAALDAAIATGEAFSQLDDLLKKQEDLKNIEQALSDEGVRLLRAEHRELAALVSQVNSLSDNAEAIWAVDAPAKTKLLEQKQGEQEVLAKALVPTGASLDQLMTLLRASAAIQALDTAEGRECPLCRRQLEQQQVDTFKQYHGLLSGQVEQEILELKAELVTAGELCAVIEAVDPEQWGENSGLNPEVLQSAKLAASNVIKGCGLTVTPSQAAKTSLSQLRSAAVKIQELVTAKDQAIQTSVAGRDEVLCQANALRSSIEPLAYASLLRSRLADLRSAKTLADAVSSWSSNLPQFTTVLTKLTNCAKHAHDELVVSDFEARLDREYVNLTEKGMASFGVSLRQIGAEVSVTVVPQIGGSDIESVLSEGELRVHALALFFAELESAPRPVLVFDDPASSFDYNYIANYCARLRDFAHAHPGCQLIVLTHNWEFFVHLQTTFNQGGLDGKLSVQVLENCAVVQSYSERVADLRAEIEAILAQGTEPTRTEKEILASKMRRLIEAVVNTHVFNGQRHQYKQRSQSVSVFRHYTKVTPLADAEATELGDLYGKLSVSEHDDPRSNYMTCDKATIQSRYDRICAVETGLAARRSAGT